MSNNGSKNSPSQEELMLMAREDFEAWENFREEKFRYLKDLRDRYDPTGKLDGEWLEVKFFMKYENDIFTVKYETVRKCLND